MNLLEQSPRQNYDGWQTQLCSVLLVTLIGVGLLLTLASAENQASAKEQKLAASTSTADSPNTGTSEKTATSRKKHKPPADESAKQEPTQDTSNEVKEEAGVEVEIEDDSQEVSEDEPEEKSSESESKPPEESQQPQVEDAEVKKRVIGATATVMEKKSELLFKARVDTGAKSCSLHIEDMKIENESETMADNIGKLIRFHIKNGTGDTHWLEAKIAGYVIVKTSGNRERRYKVPLTFRFKDMEKTVLVTLNNRSEMEFALLLGRNFLRDDFVVDVSVDNDD